MFKKLDLIKKCLTRLLQKQELNLPALLVYFTHNYHNIYSLRGKYYEDIKSKDDTLS
jgi:hypothetical protein